MNTDYIVTLTLKAQNEAKAEIEKLNWQVSSIGKVIGWWAVWKTLLSWVKSFSNELLTLWWNLEQAEVAFTTMLWSGEEANKMLKDLTNFAKKTPFELTWIRDSAKQMMAMWIESNKVLPTLKSLWDISAWLWVDLSRLAYNFWQVKSQWRLTWTELRDFTKMWIPLVNELAKSLGKTEVEIQKMVSAGQIWFDVVEKAFQDMTSEWGKFENLMEKQSWTYQWMMSNLQDSFNSIKETLWRTFIPILENVLEKLNPLIERFSNRVEKNPELATTLATVIAWAIALIWALSWISAILPIISAWFTVLTWPIWLITGAIALLATARINNWWWIRDITQSTVDTISGIIWPWLDKIKERWKEHWEVVMIYVEEIFWAIAETIWTTLWLVATIIAWAFEWIKALIDTFIAIWNWDREEVWNIAITRAENMDKLLTNAFGETRTNIKNWLQQFIDDVVAKFTALKDKIMSIVQSIKNAWNSTKDAVWWAVSSARNFVSSPFKAWWWDVARGQSYIVWERWPELFIPSERWSIVPNNQITNNNWIEINMSGITVRSESDIQSLAQEIVRQIKLEKDYWII